jgi:hypothetical protein
VKSVAGRHLQIVQFRCRVQYVELASRHAFSRLPLTDPLVVEQPSPTFCVSWKRPSFLAASPMSLSLVTL